LWLLAEACSIPRSSNLDVKNFLTGQFELFATMAPGNFTANDPTRNGGELPKFRKRNDHHKSRSNFLLYTTFHSFSNHSHKTSYVTRQIEFGLIWLVSG